MPDHHTIAVSGTITHVFGHRFVVQTSKDAVLADITPTGLEQFKLRVGDEIDLVGEMKPSELKVSKLISGGKTIAIAHKKKPHEHEHAHEHHPHAEPRDALAVAHAAGFAPVGEPRRKPKHFEVLGRRDHQLTELHIELDGRIRKMKPVDGHDPKWSEVLA